MHDESWAGVSVHGLWKWGTSALFYIQLFNLDEGSYLRQTSSKAPETSENEKKDKYLHPCLERRCSFTPMVYSVDGIIGIEAVAAQQCLSSLLSNKLNWEYSEMYGFVRACMSLAIVRFNTLLLQGARDKDAYIRQKLNMEDGAVMALLEPWRG